jgi:uncharacterized protein
MKSSQFNHFFKLEDETTLAFNSASGALAEMEKEDYPCIQNLLEHPDRAESVKEREFKDALIEGGYLVGDGVDEISSIKIKSQNNRIQGAVFTLTIAPTLACNFDCDYCFENQSSARMTREVEDSLIQFSEHQLSRSDKMRICWFGGEPTLCLPIIVRLENQLRELAEDQMVDILPSSIITNGYLLDGNMARQFMELGIAQAQITIDGPENIHDKRRKLRNGKGTFRQIINNLAETADILNIAIRINVDKGNVGSAHEVIEILEKKGILPKVKVGFAQVESTGTVCADVRDQCFCGDEFSRSQVGLYEKLIDVGYHHIAYPEVQGSGICGAICENAYSVAPNGLLFKCWEQLSLDPKNSVGDLFSTEPDKDQSHNLYRYRSWDPFQLSACRECDILPLCLGGCPVRGMEDEKAEKGTCSSWRYNLKEMLELKSRCESLIQAGR